MDSSIVSLNSAVEGQTVESTPTRLPRKSAEDPSAPAPQADAKAAAAAVGRGQAERISDGRTIEFTFDSDVNRVVVKVKSAETGEVVRQIPPEEYLKLVARFRELFGVVLDETA